MKNSPKPFMTVSNSQLSRMCYIVASICLVLLILSKCHLEEQNKEESERNRQIEKEVQEDIEKNLNRVSKHNTTGL